MSRKLTRLVLAGSVAAGFVLAPTSGAYAAERNVFAADAKFSGKTEADTGKPTTDAFPGDRVVWHITNGEHTVRPDETVGAVWPTTAKPSDKLTAETNPKYAVTFDKAGKYHFYCELHDGMVGVIDVKDQTSSTTPPPPPPPPPSTTTTTRPAVVPGPTTTTTSAPASSAGTKPPGAAAPAPTTTSTKPAKDNKDNKDKKKDDKPKEEETTTTTAPPPPAPVDIPDSAIIPVLPGAGTGTTTQNGIEAPTSTPEGEAIALLKSNKSNGGKAKKLLIVSGLGLGALGIGAAGYKWANRSSRYFPA